MLRVEAIYIAPVKSLALQAVESASIERDGLAGDRAFFLVSERGRLFTQRECGPLVRVRAEYDDAAARLRLTFPDGKVVDDTVEVGEPATTRFFGLYDVPGLEVRGPWAEALSSFAGVTVRLMRPDRRHAFDALPVSILSTASIDALRESSGNQAIEARRFRPNIVVGGAASAHEEDGWLQRDVRIGTAVVRPLMRDPRCAIVTHSPDSGERDFDTLRAITMYRVDQPKEVNFGVYGGVITPGEVRLGDEVVPAAAPAA